MERYQGRSESQSLVNDAIDAGAIVNQHIEFRTSDIHIIRGSEGGTLAEKQEAVRTEIKSLESDLENLRQEYTDITDELTTSRLSLDTVDIDQKLKRYLASGKRVKMCEARIRDLKYKLQNPLE
jgi:hypothetical protein